MSLLETELCPSSLKQGQNLCVQLDVQTLPLGESQPAFSPKFTSAHTPCSFTEG